MQHLELSVVGLVLLDLMLPGSDGIELMKRILDIAPVPVRDEVHRLL